MRIRSFAPRTPVSVIGINGRAGGVSLFWCRGYGRSGSAEDAQVVDNGDGSSGTLLSASVSPFPEKL